VLILLDATLHAPAANGPAGGSELSVAHPPLVFSEVIAVCSEGMSVEPFQNFMNFPLKPEGFQFVQPALGGSRVGMVCLFGD